MDGPPSPRVLQVLPSAAAAVTPLVGGVPPQRWTAPTPCQGWDVRTLVNHLVAEHLWAPRLLAGEGLADVGDAYDGDVLGEHPVEAWRSAIASSLLAWADVRDPDRSVEVSVGPVPVTEYASQMLVDLVVHGWDLAVATGQPYAPTAEAVAEALAYEEPRVEAGGLEGLFDPPVQTSSTAPLDRLVALLGRTPR
ncbi:TIGR03086 family metal-binding protein [Ornithinimicrobium sp. W1679]|uniref:TIGR03086 family metal-binding protein n=1 Tax=Ornithinimicrobium sp. W1679 TaxID=3418770 RepID=UPI003CE7C16C